MVSHPVVATSTPTVQEAEVPPFRHLQTIPRQFYRVDCVLAPAGTYFIACHSNNFETESKAFKSSPACLLVELFIPGRIPDHFPRAVYQEFRWVTSLYCLLHGNVRRTVTKHFIRIDSSSSAGEFTFLWGSTWNGMVNKPLQAICIDFHPGSVSIFIA